MSQVDPSRRAEAKAERSAGLSQSSDKVSDADLLTATVAVGDAVAIRMAMASIRRRMGELSTEQAKLEGALATLEEQLAALEKVTHSWPFEGATVTNKSSASTKVALFRNLFNGRPDVFPLCWENRKLARAGYSPACSNEWVRGICAKPRVKCGECPHQALILEKRPRFCCQTSAGIS